MMEKQLADNIARIRDGISEAALQSGRNPQDIRLMAVTKKVSARIVNLAIAEGVTLLGENRAQELCAKFDEYQKENTEIHFIGHLQTNKVNKVLDKVSVVQSVGSLHLAQEISKKSEAMGKMIGVLVEVNIGMEETKSGVSPHKLAELVEQMSVLPGIRVQGLMAIPPAGAAELLTEKFFSNIYSQFLDISSQKIDNVSMCTLSMGMSDDYKLAIKHGSTIVRIGSALFGNRNLE